MAPTSPVSNNSTGDKSLHDGPVRRDSVGSVSLRNDLFNIDKLLTLLKNTNTEKRKAGRTSKTKFDAGKSDVNDKIIELLDNLSCTTIKIINRVEELEKSNALLTMQIEAISASGDGAAGRSFAGVLGSPSGKQVRPSVVHADKIPTGAKDVDSRLDHLEQESLANVILCQGAAIDTLIERTKVKNVSPRDQISTIKESLLNEFNTVTDTAVHADNIPEIIVIGKDRKHLKIVCSSKHVKTNILRSVKSAKLANFYVNDYLTKTRSTLFYKLRISKKNNPSITSVYTRGGTVFCKLNNSDRPTAVFNDDDLDKVTRLTIDVAVCSISSINNGSH